MEKQRVLSDADTREEHFLFACGLPARFSSEYCTLRPEKNGKKYILLNTNPSQDLNNTFCAQFLQQLEGNRSHA